ncbi:unnamed protein product [Vicia faba]|uniref:Uncharacterized protein n=1 Tax=Vicia faba TaxID=3906 RepID=A0AAV0Z842_VICFA|nr:unnamed protein product [Vicia faba]
MGDRSTGDWSTIAETGSEVSETGVMVGLVLVLGNEPLDKGEMSSLSIETSYKGILCTSKPIDHVIEVEDNSEIELSNEQHENGVNDVVDINDETGNNDASEDSGEDSETEYDSSNDLPTRRIKPPGYLRDYVTGLENMDNQNSSHLQNLTITMFSSKEDPSSYEKAIKLHTWKKAMESEL